MTSQIIASILSFLPTGWFGVQYIYLGNKRRSVYYTIFIWTLIPIFLSIYDGIKFIRADKTKFLKKYGDIEEARKHLKQKRREETMELIRNGENPRNIEGVEIHNDQIVFTEKLYIGIEQILKKDNVNKFEKEEKKNENQNVENKRERKNKTSSYNEESEYETNKIEDNYWENESKTDDLENESNNYYEIDENDSDKKYKDDIEGGSSYYE